MWNDIEATTDYLHFSVVAENWDKLALEMKVLMKDGAAKPLHNK